MTNRIIRWWYKVLTFRDHGNMLNRNVDVQNILYAVAAGKRALLTPDECRQLARKLGGLYEGA